MGGDERGKLPLQKRRILPDDPRDRAVVVDDEIVTDFQSRKNFRPRLRLIVVDDGEREQTGAHHLKDVVVFEVLVDRMDRDRQHTSGDEVRVELAQVAEIGAGGANERLLPRKVVKRGERRRTRAGDDDFLDVPNPGRSKIDQRPPLGRDRQFAGRHVALAFHHIPDQRVARDRQEDDVNLQVAFGVSGVEPALESLSQFGDQPHLPPSVDHIEGLVVRNEEAHEPALRHAVEVAYPWPAEWGHEVRSDGRQLFRGPWGDSSECGRERERYGAERLTLMP